ncbi:MAG: M56 family metallopeptidase [Solirubrobacterales bacterium]|nr:M56 family metallopeptidase [Solirubrobacterales bacterium]
MASARRLYRLTLGLGVLAGLTLVAALATVSLAVDPASPSMAELAAACGQYVLAFSAPGLLISAVGSLGLASVLCGMRSATMQLRCQRRLRSRLEIVEHRTACDANVAVVSDPRPQAFCAGVLRARIYVSTGAIAALDARELHAVLAHEAHHAARRDPLRVFVAHVLRDSLFFLPIMRHAAERYCALAEMAADDAAVHRLGGHGPLASAMLTFEGRAPAGAVGIAPERVDHLLGEPMRWQLSASLLLAGAATLSGIAVLGAAAASAAPAGGLSMAVLVMQLCALAMAVLPFVAGVALVLTVKRALAS